jgi:hypothetical protein
MNRRLKKLLAESMLCIDAKLIPAASNTRMPGTSRASMTRESGRMQ